MSAGYKILLAFVMLLVVRCSRGRPIPIQTKLVQPRDTYPYENEALPLDTEKTWKLIPGESRAIVREADEPSNDEWTSPPDDDVTTQETDDSNDVTPDENVQPENQADDVETPASDTSDDEATPETSVNKRDLLPVVVRKTDNPIFISLSEKTDAEDFHKVVNDLDERDRNFGRVPKNAEDSTESEDIYANTDDEVEDNESAADSNGYTTAFEEVTKEKRQLLNVTRMSGTDASYTKAPLSRTGIPTLKMSTTKNLLEQSPSVQEFTTGNDQSSTIPDELVIVTTENIKQSSIEYELSTVVPQSTEHAPTTEKTPSEEPIPKTETLPFASESSTVQSSTLLGTSPQTDESPQDEIVDSDIIPVSTKQILEVSSITPADSNAFKYSKTFTFVPNSKGEDSLNKEIAVTVNIDSTFDSKNQAALDKEIEDSLGLLDEDKISKSISRILPELLARLIKKDPGYFIKAHIKIDQKH